MSARTAARMIALALVAGCGAGAGIPATDLLLSITPAAFEVAPGEPFPLTVTRVWRKDLVPAEWSDKALAPLALRLEGVDRREDKVRVQETRRYAAHAFSLKDVVVPAARLVAKPRDGGAERKVTATGFRIRVRPALDPESPGPPELPGEPPARRGWIGWGAGGLALLVSALFLVLRRKQKAAAPPPAPPRPPPITARDRALARIRGATVEEAAEAVRAFLEEAKVVPALQRTTEELLPRFPALGAVLRVADLAKFALRAPSPGERDAAVSAAETFVREALP